MRRDEHSVRVGPVVAGPFSLVRRPADPPSPGYGVASKRQPYMPLHGYRLAPIFHTLSVLCAVLCAAGCANYRLGSSSPLPFQRLYLEPATNRTMLPQAQAMLSTQLREAFARDPRITLVNSAAAAEATLTVVIDDYHREVAAAREDDTGLARKFNVTLGVACTLRDNRTGKNLFENRPVAAMREVFTDSGQLQAEYQTLPLLAGSLATKVVHATLDVW